MKYAAIFGALLFFSGLIFHPFRSESLEPVVVKFPLSTASLQTGDLVFRQGKGFISDLFKNISTTERKFSHVGVLVFENNQPFVYHVIGFGEDERGGLRKDKLEDFCNPKQNTSFAIYRNQFVKDHDQSVISYFNNLSHQQIKFDEQFDFVTNDQLYCSEMVYKFIQSISGQQLPLTSFHGENYVAIDNLYADPITNQLIYSFQYTSQP